MPTGLLLNSKPVKNGGVNLQPVKAKVIPLKEQNDEKLLVTKANVVAPQVMLKGVEVKPAKFLISPTPIIVNAFEYKGVSVNRLVDALKLQSTRVRRARVVAEKGVSTFRPEVVAGVRFRPAYEGHDGSTMTPVGELIELQMAARNIRVDNINAFVQELKEDEQVASLLRQLESEYNDRLEQAKVDVEYLLGSYIAIDQAVRSLDIVGQMNQLRLHAVRASGGDVFDLKDLFVGHLGYSELGFNRFTNTKVFGQLAFDLGNSVRRYTPELFGIVDADRPHDYDPYRYDRTVSLSNGQFTFDISDFGDEDQVANAFDVKFFNRFVGSLPRERADRVKLLSVTISRLVGTSAALGSPAVQADLQRLGIDAGGVDPVVDVVGIPGQTIMDEPNRDRSLVGLSYVFDNDVNDVVLPMERRYIIDRADRRYVPGVDYFFDGLVGREGEDFDLTRFVDYSRGFQTGATRALNVLEACARTDTPHVRQLYGDAAGKLRADNIYRNALSTLADVLTLVQDGDPRSKNYLFIFALFELAQADKKLRNLMFQLAALTVIFNDLRRTDVENIGIINSMRSNEVRKYRDFPSLFGYVGRVVAADNIFEDIDIGEIETTHDTNAVEAAYRQVQRLVIDRAFLLLSQRSNTGTVVALSKKSAQGKQVAKQQLQGFASKGTKATIVGSIAATQVFNIERPDFDQSFDDDFRAVMFSIARFIDDFEDAAALGGGGSGRLVGNKHLRSDRSGRSRYLSVSSSTRFLMGYELMATLLGSFDYARFGDFDQEKDVVGVVWSKTRLRTVAKAAVSSFISLSAASAVQHVDLQQTVHVGDSLQQVKEGAGAVNKFIGSVTGEADDELVRELEREFRAVRGALVQDRQVIRSMTLNMRSIVSSVERALDDVTTHFNVPNRTFDEFNFNLTATSATHSGAKVYNLIPIKTKASKRATRSSYNRTYNIIGTQIAPVNVREKEARRIMVSKQQAALSIVQLRNIAVHDMKYSPTQLHAVSSTGISDAGAKSTSPGVQSVSSAGLSEKDVFVDGGRIRRDVQEALKSMLALDRFCGDRARDVKLLSVGIPAGFSDRLEDSDLLRVADRTGAQADRELDVVTVDVHMRDIIEDDVVFKPRKFPFEMSRFVSAFSFEGADSRHSPRDGIRTYSDVLASGVRMMDVSSLSLGNVRGQFGRDFMTDERYSFMPDDVRREVLYNHVTSFLLSVYVKMLTGMDLREDTFLVEPEGPTFQSAPTTTGAFQSIAARLIEKSGSSLQLEDLRNSYPEFDRLISSIEAGEHFPGVLEEHRVYDTASLPEADALLSQDLVDLARLNGIHSSLTGGERLARKVSSPKLFERLFHVAVDPYDFKVDVEETQSTTAGAEALRRLRLDGRLVEASDPTTGRTVAQLVRPGSGDDVVAVQFYAVVSRYVPPSRHGAPLSAATTIARPVTNLKGIKVGGTSVVKRAVKSKTQIATKKALAVKPKLVPKKLKLKGG